MHNDQSLVSFPSVQSIPYSPESGVISVASTKPKLSHIVCFPFRQIRASMARRLHILCRR
ncbi:uncharacterized protein PODANS_6_2510 [Podospora anserina S mat+]|uniref:Podospora anserina S mat+ genomic DNA chromosome 6, supercontig 2 n=2 Tax=Podospora TaxID=5144 RepID=B2B2P4_PODAN|nr:uncharacterized protein PODANS_6_2510 [Podospora anserina S mat+]CAP71379.1 unnamed protein product [Podospora anserina S mat+]CDP30779.1 Putative protein of unknown function [Podospora anserina S mat+]